MTPHFLLFYIFFIVYYYCDRDTLSTCLYCPQGRANLVILMKGVCIMLTKKFIIDFIGNSFYHERLTREIRKQPMSKSEIRNFVKMELIDLLQA